VKPARWLDHLPPWLGWGAIAATGAYGPGAVAVMALPLLLAALVEWRGWQLAGWQRGLELTVLAAFLLQVAGRAGLLPTVVNLLFLLCGVRLCLPRSVSQRRQLILMGFLLFLTTALTTTELDFLLGSVVWLAAAAAMLLRLAWEKSAGLHRGPSPPPPYAQVLGWSVSALVLAAGFFVLLPRLHANPGRIPGAVPGMGGFQSGLSEELDLGGSGPIRASREVALRIMPVSRPSGQALPGYRAALGLLRGLSLERLDGQRWEVSPGTPRRDLTQWAAFPTTPRPVMADFFVEPGPLGILPLPYGVAELELATGSDLRFGQGGSLRWAFQGRRAGSLRVALTPAEVDPEAPPRGARLAMLTDPGTGTESAREFSLREAPGTPGAQQLAERLSLALRARFSYTLDNPSGAAANPLRDFLERSHAGHCEYFASALALMLRYRQVPARVANGYRLGPWIQEGGYFLVTQGEAHSWVEYYDDASGGWRVADPTPPDPGSLLDSPSLLGALARWADTLRFRWDRNVVRFSGEDQLAGADWVLGRMAAWPGIPPFAAWWIACAAVLGGLGALAGFRRRWFRPGARSAHPGGIRELRPLLRKARRTLPPLEGETARDWLGRMARMRPHRAEPLRRLAREADAVAYGGAAARTLKALAREEARRWS
jgi:transglutaminase-like putative cysteine protease